MKRVILLGLLTMALMVCNIPVFSANSDPALLEKAHVSIDTEIVKIKKHEAYYTDKSGKSYKKNTAVEVIVKIVSADLPDNFYKTNPFINKWIQRNSRGLVIVLKDANEIDQKYCSEYAELPAFIRSLSEAQTSSKLKPANKFRLKGKLSVEVKKGGSLADSFGLPTKPFAIFTLYKDGLQIFEMKK